MGIVHNGPVEVFYHNGVNYIKIGVFERVEIQTRAAALQQFWEEIPPALVAAYLYSFVFVN